MARDRGGVRFHRNGWELRVQVDGRRRTKRVAGENDRQGRREAEMALERWIETLETNPDGITVAQAIARYEAANSPRWSPSTQATHGYHARPVIDALGAKPVADLRAHHIQELYNRWSAEGVGSGTIRRRHSLFAAALSHAERQRWILRSPMGEVQLPPKPIKFDDLPTAARCVEGIGRIEQDRLRHIALLALSTGCRRGEIVGLRWSDLSFEAGTLRVATSVVEDGERHRVRKSPKGGRSRTIGLDQVTLRDLRAWRAMCVEHAFALGVALADSFPIFASPSDPSQPVLPGRVTQDWMRWRSKVGLDGLRFHDLRHRHATTLLEEGVPVHKVSKRLGHSTPSTTLNVYAHAIDGDDEQAVAVIETMRGAG